MKWSILSTHNQFPQDLQSGQANTFTDPLKNTWRISINTRSQIWCAGRIHNSVKARINLPEVAAGKWCRSLKRINTPCHQIVSCSLMFSSTPKGKKTIFLNAAHRLSFYRKAQVSTGCRLNQMTSDFILQRILIKVSILRREALDSWNVLWLVHCDNVSNISVHYVHSRFSWQQYHGLYEKSYAEVIQIMTDHGKLLLSQHTAGVDFSLMSLFWGC